MTISASRMRTSLTLISILVVVAPPPAAPNVTQEKINSPSQAVAAQAAATKAQDARRRRTLNVTVTDGKGGFATRLGREDFAVYDRGAPQQIVSFRAADEPLSVGILLDASGSMNSARGSKKRRAALLGDAVSKFVGRGRAGNEYFVVGFNQSPQMILEQTRDPEAVVRAADALSNLKTKGQTALYDACYLAIDKLSYGTHPRRSLLIVTDGQDNASRYKFTELRRLLMEQDVMVYAIGITGGVDDTALDVAGRAILEELAEVSGGLALFPENEKAFIDAAEHIALELRLQYSVVVEFAPSEKRDGWRELAVKVTPAVDKESKKKTKLYARTRKGFYDTPPGPR